jgi:hypothetical protein
MIWIEVVCDGCNNNPFGETYRSNSASRIKKEAREAGWKTIKERYIVQNVKKG